MHSRLAIGCVWSAAALIAAGCERERADEDPIDASTTERDASGRADRDASADAAARAEPAIVYTDEEDPTDDPTLCSGELPVPRAFDVTTKKYFDPDWSCYGQAEPAPAPGPRRALLTFESIVPLLDGVTVDLFFGSSTLGAPAQTHTFGGSVGQIAFDVPADAARLSLRVHELTHPIPSFSVGEIRGYDLPIPRDGSPIVAFAMLRESLELTVDLGLEGEEPDRDKALLLSVARDCRGRELSGVQFELVDGQTERPVETGTAPGLPRSIYFQSALPHPPCTFTSKDLAVWMMANAPVNVEGEQRTHPYRLRLKARRSAGDSAPVILAETPVELLPATASMVRVHREHPR